MSPDVDRRVCSLLATADLVPPRRLDTLRRPSPLHPAIHLETIEARSLLQSQRLANAASPNVASPVRLWRSVRPLKPQRQEAAPNPEAFSDHEVATVLDALLAEYPLKPVGLAQALLRHASASTLDQLWRSRHDNEQRTEVPWLNHIIRLNKITSPRELEYMQLLCETGATAEVLNAALGIAFQQGCDNAIGLLLSYGADASRCRESVRKRSQREDLDMIRSLLAAPCVMPIEVWRHVLHPCEQVAPVVLSQCLSHRPGIANEHMLIRALSAHTFSATAVILAHTSSDELARYDQNSACKIISAMDASDRYAYFDLLNEAGLLYDSPTLREEVLRDVQDREMQLVHLLVTAGVRLDAGPLNALRSAVIQMDLEMLDVLARGTFDNASVALDWIPPNATEQGILKVLEKLCFLSLDGDALNRRLIYAVRCRHILEATELVRMGASVDYKQASALHLAIRNSDTDMLDILLQGVCTRKALSGVIPALVKVRPQQKRQLLLEKVLSKGTLPEMLGGPLETLLAERKADLGCVALLLRFGASPDASDEESTTSVLVAAHNGWLHVLRLLCEASVRPLILAKAVCVAFRQSSTADYDDVSLLKIMRLLLSKGAKGTPVDQALLSAVMRGSRKDVLDLLTSFGASANHKQGEAFVVALTSGSSRTFEVLCKSCPPNLASTERLIPLAMDQRYYALSNLGVLLECTQHKRAALDGISAESIGKSPDMSAIVRCLLSHGLRINGGECKFLRLAVLADDISLLRDMLAAKPNVLSLQLAFEKTARIQERSSRLNVMKLLLKHASGTEIGQTICIADQTQLAIDGDLEGLRLILHHGASVDHQGGIAVQKAAVSGHLEVLRLLLKYRPVTDTVTQACLACLKPPQKGSYISPDHKNTIYETLLNASAGTDNSPLSSLLQASVQSVPCDVRFPTLLFRRGAKVCEKTVRVALETGSDDLLHLIIRRSSGRELFHLAFECEMSQQRRTWLVSEWLKQNIRQVDKSRALLQSLGAKKIQDLHVTDLLLKHGADVSFLNGEAFKLAVRAQSADAIQLLSRNITTRTLANIAFQYASQATFNDPRIRLEIYRSLLDANLVDKSVCYTALKKCLDRQGADLDTVRLLVTKGADPCASCFISAFRIGTTKQFRELCKGADLNRIVDALLSSFRDEADAARWFKLCLEDQPPSAKITNADLLPRCIKKYPQGHIVAGLILAKSKITSQTLRYSVFPGWAEEECSVLIWALLSRPRVSSMTILKLLGAGCDVDSETPVTHVSAPMACLLDSSRTPILRALLKTRPELAIDHFVSPAVWACLGTQSGPAPTNDISPVGTVTLCQASVYLGNIDGFELLEDYYVSDEDMLHLAAFLALPKFVKKFLATHDPNLESEAYKNYTPLAVALETDSGQPWCRVADAEAPFEDRRKATIELLAPRSKVDWRFREKTYIHMALAMGPETTKSLLDAFGIANNPWPSDMLVYKDKAGRQYTPCEYVRELMTTQPSEQHELMRCLAGGNLLTDAELVSFGWR